MPPNHQIKLIGESGVLFRCCGVTMLWAIKDTLESLKRVAVSRDMSLQALLKFYIGQGLRQDVARLFGDQMVVD